MQFPFEDDDASDASMRRFPRILVVALVCLLLLGLIGFWRLQSRRHEAAQAPEPVNASTDALANEPESNSPEPTPTGAPSNPSAPRTSVNAEPARTAESDAAALGFDSSVPNVTAKTLEVFGEKYKGQIVQMSGCRFIDISNTYPNMFVELHAPEYRNYCGLSVEDSKHDIFLFAFALKEEYGATLLGLKRGDAIALKGKCVGIPLLTSKYGLLCTEIKVGQPATQKAEAASEVKPAVAGDAPDAKSAQRPDQQNSPNGFWLSRSSNKSDERVAFSFAQRSNRSDGDGSIHFDQNFSRAAIGRKVEAGEQLFVHDFSVEFLPNSAQGTDSGSRGRGLWFICDASSKYKLGYDREKLSAKAKRRTEPTRLWLSIDDDFVKLVVGRYLTRGERAFLHDPKIDKIP